MLIVCIIIAVFAAAADQVTKALIFGHDRAFIPGLIRFESVENRGMVWGLGNGMNGFTIAISVFTVFVIAILIFVMIKYRAHMTKLIGICLAAIIGGAIGNLIDRFALGFVRDFICTEFISFPVFNVADCFVTCGAILLGVLLIFTKSGHRFVSAVFPDEKKKNAPSEVE